MGEEYIPPLEDETSKPIDDHYMKMNIQPMTFSMANGLDADQHTVIKYVARYKHKKGKRDLLAARWMIDWMLQYHYGEDKNGDI